MSTVDIKLSPFQQGVVQDTSRFCVIAAGRRVGKSYGVAAKLLSRIGSYKSGSNIVIMSKTHANLKTIWLPMIRDIFPDAYIDKVNLSELTITLVNGVVIHLKSGADANAVDSLRGISLVHAIIDEAAFINNFEYAWQDVIMPALADQMGTADFVSSPNGHNGFYDLYQRGRSPEFTEWGSHHATWREAFNKEAVALMAAEAQRTVDPITYAREWEASFEGSGKRVYYSFDMAKHVTSEILPLGPKEPVCIGIDFNVGRNDSIVFATRGSRVEVLECLSGFSNTTDLCEELVARYAGHKIIAYPDPAGNARKTSAPVGVTDLSILRKHGIEVHARKSTRSIQDGVNAVNALLHQDTLVFHPNASLLIKSLDRLSWKEGSTTNKYADDQWSHSADALRYPVEFLHSLNHGTLRRKKNAKGF